MPTRHRLTSDKTTAYACCALDALAVPFLVDDPATLVSDCAECGGAITVRVHGEHVLATSPEAPMVFYVARDCCAAGPAIVTRCPFINFFCGAEHAGHWLAAHPDRSGPLLALPEAIAEARRHFDRTIRLVRNADPS
ncbi:MAG TPA: alkylmercury lyase family protein [bacterium]|nr:alkylmercury lyase family protein [bacterium]